MQSQFGTKHLRERSILLELTEGKMQMSARITKLFTDHPASVDETYFGHMAFAGWFASRLFLAGGAALVHAFLPFLCETTASTIVRELYERTSKRGAGHGVTMRQVAEGSEAAIS
jgi:hypothetical protein